MKLNLFLFSAFYGNCEQSDPQTPNPIPPLFGQQQVMDQVM
jgi:hypothetical protein